MPVTSVPLNYDFLEAVRYLDVTYQSGSFPAVVCRRGANSGMLQG